MYHRLLFRDFDSEGFREVLDRADLEHIILSRAPCRAAVEQFRTPDFSIDCGHYSFPVVARGQFAPGNLCIGMAWGERVPTWLNGIHVGRRHLQLYTEGSDILYRAGTEAKWIGLTVTRERLQIEAAQRLGRELPLPADGARHLQVGPDITAQLIETMHRVTSGNGVISREPDQLSKMVIGAYVEALASADLSVATSIRQRAEYRLTIVRHADAVMRCLIGRTYSSSQVCKSLGVSERSLELHFQDALGVSPKAWFQHLALHRARTELLRRKPHRGLVTEVALDCGFEHFGRFSRCYLDLFGESPSETVAHALYLQIK
ncbi:MAG TPA: helix-turn-helix domain-containing protein [Terriglobales bacterium]|jgi:AraC-like DNA-binding protein